MRIKIKNRWGSHLPNTIISVSVDRARYLCEELKIAKPLDKWPDDAPAAAKTEPGGVLMGTDILPADIEYLPGKIVSLGTVIQAAFKESASTEEEWNGMEPSTRDGLVMAAVVDLRESEINKMNKDELNTLATALEMGDKYNPSANLKEKRQAIQVWLIDLDKE